MYSKAEYCIRQLKRNKNIILSKNCLLKNPFFGHIFEAHIVVQDYKHPLNSLLPLAKLFFRISQLCFNINISKFGWIWYCYWLCRTVSLIVTAICNAFIDNKIGKMKFRKAKYFSVITKIGMFQFQILEQIYSYSWGVLHRVKCKLFVCSVYPKLIHCNGFWICHIIHEFFSIFPCLDNIHQMV